MKSAEEWAAMLWDADVSGPDECCPLIKQIQLDAMKDGMRWAADLAVRNICNNQRPTESAVGLANRQRDFTEQAILSAAEALTEKDIV